jgi:choline-sulfatase
VEHSRPNLLFIMSDDHAMYYRYWMHNDTSHGCPAHYGVRTRTHKLICYYNDPLDQLGARGPSRPVEWELFDLTCDPLEVRNIHGQAGSEAITAELLAELRRLQTELGDSAFAQAN